MENLSLLFVDDEPNVLCSIRRNLHKENYKAHFATGAKEALNILHTTEVNIIITDLEMPGIDGFHLLIEIEKKFPNAVRLVLSGLNDSESILGAINDGRIFGYINKPVDRNGLLAAIQQAAEYFISKQEKRDLLKKIDEDNKKLTTIVNELSISAFKISKGIYERLPEGNNKEKFEKLYHNFNLMINGLEERDLIRNTFGKYVDRKIAKELLNNPDATHLGGRKRTVTIFMSDLRNFASLSQNLDAEKVLLYLNNYYSYVINIINKFNGIIVDFYGDGLLCFFDTLNNSIDQSIRSAIGCAVNLQKGMKDFNKKNISVGYPMLNMGIGLNIGEVIVGNIGSDSRAKYGIVGSPVNITNRIQSYAKPGEIILSQSFYTHIRDEVLIKKVIKAELKGFDGINTLHVLEEFYEFATQKIRAK